MAIDRESTLKKFIAQKPDDPFPRYGLALEYVNTGRLEDAVATFAELVERLPDYVPAYLHYGGVLSRLGRADEARGVYGRGIERARKKGDSHALGELEGALAAL